MFYLETNGIIALANSLGDEKLQEVSSTSAFSILELISGLNEDNFSRKRGPLKKLKESNIRIEWIMPEEKLCCSFPIISYKEKRTEDLKTIFQVLCESESFEEVPSKLNKCEVHFDLEYFAEYDQRWRDNFINSTIKGNKRIRQIVDEDQDQPKTLQEVDQNLELNTLLTIYSFAIQLSDNLDIDVEETLNSYNGKNIMFMKGFSTYGIGKMLNKQLPAKNDIFDLTHLLYLDDHNTVIVSDDRIFKSMVDKVPDLNLLNNSDFLDRIDANRR